jgi:hypothetical protein
MLPALSLGWRHTPDAELVSFGLPEADAALGGLPRGRITEIAGQASSGRTTFLDSILTAATRRDESCVLIDTRDAFDPPSAAVRGVELKKLIWIRCGGNAEKAMRAADLMLHNGGFGVVALDLADLPQNMLARIPPASWFRFRRAVEAAPTALVVLSTRPLTKSCSTLLIEMRRRRGEFLRSVDFEIVPRKPVGREAAAIHVCLHPLAA